MKASMLRGALHKILAVADNAEAVRALAEFALEQCGEIHHRITINSFCGEKIPFIRDIRSELDVGLKEAKDFVEGAEAQTLTSQQYTAIQATFRKHQAYWESKDHLPG